MPHRSAVWMLPLLMLAGFAAVDRTAPAKRDEPTPAALDPLDAPRIALARFDEAAAHLRADRFAAARRLLQIGAHELPSPYREQANVAAEQIYKSFLATGTTKPRPGSAEYLRARIDLATYLGDFRAAADHSWWLAELDPARFARDGYAMQMLRDFLVWSECSIDELQKLVRLAVEGQPIESSRHYGQWGVETDIKNLRPRTASTEPVAKMRAYFETTRDFRDYELGGPAPRHALFLLLTFLPVAEFSDAQKQAIGDMYPRIAYRIASALEGLGDQAGSEAWRQVARSSQRSDVGKAHADAESETLFDRAKELFHHRDYVAALTEYRSVAALGQEHKSWGAAQFNVGICLTSLKRYDEAEAAFRQLIGGDVDDAEPVSLMQWHRNYRSSAAAAIASCYAARGEFREANRWLADGHFKYHVWSGCGTCDQQATTTFRNRWAFNLWRAGPNAREREAVWISLYYDIGGGLGGWIADDAHRRRASAELLREIDERLQRPLYVHQESDRYRGGSPADFLTEPDLYMAQSIGLRRWDGGNTSYNRTKLMSLRRMVDLAALEEADRRSDLFRALINQPLGIYEIYWHTRRQNVESERQHAREAAAYFLADRAKAERWLREHAPVGPNEQAWHQVLSAALGLPETVDLMVETYARAVAQRVPKNSTRGQRLERRDVDVFRDMEFLPDRAKAEFYARTKSLQEFTPLTRYNRYGGQPRYPIELGK